MIPSKPDIAREVGLRYFTNRFCLDETAGSQNTSERIGDLPIEYPRAREIRTDCDALVLDGLRLPTFQQVRRVDGRPILVCLSKTGPRPVAALENGALELGFDPWLCMGAGLMGVLPSPTMVDFRFDALTGTPWVDRFANRLAAELVGLGGELRSIPRWPNKAPFALCLTHDVDRVRKTFQYLTHLGPRRSLRIANQHRSLTRRPYWGFEELRRIEKDSGVRSTIFVLHEGREGEMTGLRGRLLSWGLADFAQPELAQEVQSLAENGWEIGLHASLSSVGRPSRISSEKRLLEDLLHVTTAGVRQHYLRLDLPRRWEEFANAGFVYDSSYGFRDRWGFRSGSAFPFQLWGRDTGLDLWELPLHLMEATLEHADDPATECTRMLDEVASVGGVMTVLFHQRYFDSRNYPGYTELYQRILREATARGAWIGRAADMLEAWTS